MPRAAKQQKIYRQLHHPDFQSALYCYQNFDETRTDCNALADQLRVIEAGPKVLRAVERNAAHARQLAALILNTPLPQGVFTGTVPSAPLAKP